MQHPIDSMMQTTMENIRGMVDVNTVVGSPVAGAKDTTIIPISKVSFGFVAGGGEYAVEDHRSRTMSTDVLPFAGGTGAGVSVQPVGFLVVGENTVKMLPAQTNGAMERVVELLPQLLEEFSQNGEKKPKADKVFKTEIETYEYSGTEDQKQS
ncbi:MAG: GerW family sporulation protein [Clostridia bacterium]|nr:GerW family sporulation protein [Clostridia bacterium]